MVPAGGSLRECRPAFPILGGTPTRHQDSLATYSSSLKNGETTVNPPVSEGEVARCSFSCGMKVATSLDASSSAALCIASHVPRTAGTSYTRPGTSWLRLTRSYTPLIGVNMRMRISPSLHRRGHGGGSCRTVMV